MTSNDKLKLVQMQSSPMKHNGSPLDSYTQDEKSPDQPKVNLNQKAGYLSPESKLS